MYISGLNSLFNIVQVVGRLCAAPQKNYTRNKILKTTFLIKTDGNTIVPFKMYGQSVDIACTKFKLGDIVAIRGKVSSKSSKKGKLRFTFYATDIALVSRCPKELPTEDRFKKIVDLYCPQKIDERL